MPQVLKEHVDRRLREAALAAFADRGYAAAGIAEIARRAGISAGNVYHYFPDKAALFAAVLPPDLVARFRRLLQEWAGRAEEPVGPRLTAASDVASPVAPPFAPAARALVDFILAHRLEVVILLGQATGTPYSALPEEAAQLLVSAVREPLRNSGAEPSAPLEFAVAEIQRSYVWALVRILETFTEADQIGRALADYERYHRAGLRALLARGPSVDREEGVAALGNVNVTFTE